MVKRDGKKDRVAKSNDFRVDTSLRTEPGAEISADEIQHQGSVGNYVKKALHVHGLISDERIQRGEGDATRLQFRHVLSSLVQHQRSGREKG